MKFELYDRPGIYLGNFELNKLHEEILEVAKSSLDEIPHYQCLTGERKEYSRLMIAVARNKEGRMLGFCSSYILTDGGREPLLHLGLTCVHPMARRGGFTHKLTSKVVVAYLLRYSLFKPVWVSNVASVVSSLGNVALNFEDVYPSPFVPKPSQKHLSFARMIDTSYRNELYIGKNATFRENGFVFENSVADTMFEKSGEDRRYHHRDQDLTHFYLGLMDFENGDEVLQIGRVSLMTYPRYLLKKVFRKFKRQKFLTEGLVA